MNLKSLGIALTASVLLVACQSKKTTEPSLAKQTSPVMKLVNEYTKDNLQFNPIRATFIGIPGYNDKFSPIISDENRAKYLAFEKKYLQKALTVNADNLQGQDLLTYKVFLRDRQMAIEGNSIPSHLVPINQMYGFHNFFAQLGSGQSAQPFKNEQDYRDFIKRSVGFAKWMDSAIEAMRRGIQQNIVQPRPIVAKVIPQLKTHLISDVSESLFYGPLKKLPDTIDESSRSQLIKDYEDNIRQVIIPAYQRMYDFMQSEYLPAARETVGLSELPGGESWYQFMIKTHTTLPLTSDEIHDYGKQEVARILAEMKKVKQTVKFDGSLSEFFEFLRTDDQFYYDNEQDLVDAYTNVKHKIDAKLPMLFEVFPKADYEVRPVPKYRAASAAGASYEGPAPDGSRPGIFFINTHNLKSQPKFLMETLSIHEAAPGHHFQIAIQQEVKDLPNYRKFGGYTVFAEGWALYAESLGKELGLFTDPYMWYGRLVDEQLRAMRLVVDTGLHSKGWTREQAIEYMLANSSMARSDVEAEVERYIVIPGQALAYKIGQRKIRELREYGEKTLGDKFDVKKFHTQVLIDGSLPMPILEEKIKLWLATQG
ncbi:DUF885 domain-containing protein [Aliikangiella coralliicola]|uniref:DUF885 domain-containing protein n=1 Tax=Aliikangiella coralliicola TaxID=2592383 RepID=A0A545UA86_9GAMM|nr:DUF885 domain-containing protein [Aliikangiella coralliicola]TQV86385.1 DUF885 domain-containing protein [Aliikangiella coralliicola]